MKHIPDGMHVMRSALVAMVACGLHLCRTSASATEFRRLTSELSPDTYPTWSPDGQSIAYASQQDIWVIARTGGTPTNLTRSVIFDGEPDWSPDGATIVITSYGGVQGLWTIPATGGVRDLLPNGCGGRPGRWAHWSPDGTRIAFASGDFGSRAICIMDIAGTNSEELTEPGHNGYPTWSPDGAWIAYSTSVPGDIWASSADGVSRVQITSDPSHDWEPDWSPDGRYLVFTSERSGNWDLWVIPAIGGEALQITTDRGSDYDPVWSPDGGEIAFVSDRSGNADIWTLPTSHWQSMGRHGVV